MDFIISLHAGDVNFFTSPLQMRPARRPVDEQCDEDEHGRGRKADRVHEHDRPERVVQRKHGVDPHDAHAAHAEERQDRRNERDAKAAQVAGQDLIRQAEDIQPDV